MWASSLPSHCEVFPRNRLLTWVRGYKISFPSPPEPLQVTLWEASSSQSLGPDWESITEAGWEHEVGGSGSINERLGACGSPDAWPDCIYTPLTHAQLHHSFPLLLSPGAAMFTVDWLCLYEQHMTDWYLQWVDLNNTLKNDIGCIQKDWTFFLFVFTSNLFSKTVTS